jgi:hypothetical protein
MNTNPSDLKKGELFYSIVMSLSLMKLNKYQTRRPDKMTRRRLLIRLRQIQRLTLINPQ